MPTLQVNVHRACFCLGSFHSLLEGGGGEAVPTNKNHVPASRMKTFFIKNQIFHENNAFFTTKNALLSNKKDFIKKKRLRRTHWPQTKKIVKQCLLQKRILSTKKKRLRRTHWPQTKKIKKMFTPKTHFIPKKKSACGVRTGAKKKKKSQNIEKPLNVCWKGGGGGGGAVPTANGTNTKNNHISEKL